MYSALNYAIKLREKEGNCETETRNINAIKNDKTNQKIINSDSILSSLYFVSRVKGKTLSTLTGTGLSPVLSVNKYK